MSRWYILTGEYPPHPGGVADYTKLLADELVRCGDEVHVWTASAHREEGRSGGPTVHVLPDRFGARSRDVLDAVLQGNPDVIVLVQYVPQAFGLRGMNIPFAVWLWRHRRRRTWIMFHEVAVRFHSLKPTILVLAGATHLMAAIARRAADRIFVSIPAWTDMLGIPPGRRARVHWLPVPSNVPLVEDGAAAKAIRARHCSGERLLIGHFGTFGTLVWELLRPVIGAILDNTRHIMLLMGRNSVIARAELLQSHAQHAGRIVATGELSARDLSLHLQACDIAVQPYPDGVSARRGSVMAMLAHGIPVVTSHGRLTEPVWRESGAVALAPTGDTDAFLSAVTALAADDDRRTMLGSAGKRLHDAEFSIGRTVENIRRLAEASRT